MRYNLVCCGLVGIQVGWQEENEYPENYSWVEAIGTFGWVERGESRLMGIHLSSLNVVDEEPGQRFVSH